MRIITCVYCGNEYPQNTPTHGNQVLTDHIKICNKHPMRKAEEDKKLLRSALIGMIGVDTENELRQMEAVIISHMPESENKVVSINAIHALLSTMPSKL